MPHIKNPPPPQKLSKAIDQLERIREELLTIQRTLEKLERVPPVTDPSSED